MDWTVSDEYGLWMVEHSLGRDAFSLNFCEVLNIDEFEKQLGGFTYNQLKEFVENKWRVDKSYFDRFVIQ